MAGCCVIIVLGGNMCTAVSFLAKNHYFGRNLDYEFSYNETVTITPRNYPFKFRRMGENNKHYAMIGMAFVQENYPLYYDATNEKGLSIAGLNFPGNAVYPKFNKSKNNVAPFEFIPYILCSCKSVAEAKLMLANINIYDENFSASLPHSPLHWLISDKKESIVVEPLNSGVKIYANPIGVLTNNPTFDFHLTNLANYANVSCEEPLNRFSKNYSPSIYSRGMGGIGLPGDLSSASRFVKASFTKLNSLVGENEVENVNQFFHILRSVEQQKGCCKVEKGYEYTIYSSCCNTTKGIYYYTTYLNSQIVGVDMNKENLNDKSLKSYPLLKQDSFTIQN